MSVTSVGASPFPTPPLPHVGQPEDGRANKPNDQNPNGAVVNAANPVINNGAANTATNNDTNPPPPVQAAKTPGTGQKVDIFA